MSLPIHKQTSNKFHQEAPTIITFKVIFEGIILKLEKDEFMSIVVIHCNRRQERVSMPKCSLK